MEDIGAKRVSVIAPGGKLDYRFGTLHLTIRPKGCQPHPAVLFRGKTYTDIAETEKRKKEMESFSKYDVHVLWQKNAWLNEEISTQHYPSCFESDLGRLGLEGKKVLLILDNLGAQKTGSFKRAMSKIKVKCAYGPKNGTDVWQPVDHGIGREYQ